MAAVTDFLHLFVVVAGVGSGAWVLIALRRRLPRGRFVLFTATSSAAVFGCAALSGEVGLLPPTAWFAVIMAFIVATVVVGYRSPLARVSWR